MEEYNFMIKWKAKKMIKKIREAINKRKEIQTKGNQQKIDNNEKELRIQLIGTLLQLTTLYDIKDENNKEINIQTLDTYDTEKIIKITEEILQNLEKDILRK